MHLLLRDFYHSSVYDLLKWVQITLNIATLSSYWRLYVQCNCQLRNKIFCQEDKLKHYKLWQAKLLFWINVFLCICSVFIYLWWMCFVKRCLPTLDRTVIVCNMINIVHFNWENCRLENVYRHILIKSLQKQSL